ncbi:MAG: hypothetical protein RL597_1206 [Pseudomonadota bacterium]
MLGVQALHALAGDVGIDLSRRQIGVTQEHLHHAQISAVIEQMRGEGVTQGMRRQRFVDPSRLCVSLDEIPKGLARHRLTAASRKPVVRATPAENFFSRATFETPQPVDSLGTERNETLAITLTHHSNHTLIEIHLSDTQTHEFGNTQPRGVEQLEHGSITEAERVVKARGFE